MSKFTVRTDLGINPHDHLDFLLKYSNYLNTIKIVFNGYISQHHFVKLFDENDRHLKEVVKTLIEDKWVGASPLGKYNMLYLKRKSNICLTENSRNGDLKPPTMYQVLRSIMLSEALTDSFITNDFKVLLPDVY